MVTGRLGLCGRLETRGYGEARHDGGNVRHGWFFGGIVGGEYRKDRIKIVMMSRSGTNLRSYFFSPS